LLPACIEGEAAVSGRHADNVGPALLGGFLLVTGVAPSDMHPIPVPPEVFGAMWLAMITPDVAVPTAKARAVLPHSVPLRDMVRQTANVARLVLALHTGDVRMIGAAMAQDAIIEPARAHLMPGLNEVRLAAREAGALGTAISGAGPTLCAVCGSLAVARGVLTAAEAIYERIGLAARAHITHPSARGVQVRVIEEE
jgi:homoserine kinase